MMLFAFVAVAQESGVAVFLTVLGWYALSGFRVRFGPGWHDCQVQAELFGLIYNRQHVSLVIGSRRCQTVDNRKRCGHHQVHAADEFDHRRF